MALPNALPLLENFSGEFNFCVKFPNPDKPKIVKSSPYCVTTPLLPLGFHCFKRDLFFSLNAASADSWLIVLVFGDFEEMVRPKRGRCKEKGSSVPRDHYGRHKPRSVVQLCATFLGGISKLWWSGLAMYHSLRLQYRRYSWNLEVCNFWHGVLSWLE